MVGSLPSSTLLPSPSSSCPPPPSSPLADTTRHNTPRIMTSGPRSAKLQKRLQRRNNSLKPSYDFEGDLYHSVHSRTPHGDCQATSQEAREENPPDLVEATDESASEVDCQQSQQQQQQQEQQKPSQDEVDDGTELRDEPPTHPPPPPVADTKEFKNQLEVLAESIKMQQERLERPPAVAEYLPVASPRTDPPLSRNNYHYLLDVHNNGGGGRSPNAPLPTDAEQEYRNLFHAPSHILLEDKATFDTAEVSEITTPHTMNMKGASFAQRRLAAGRLQQRLDQPRLPVVHHHHPSFSRHGRGPDDSHRDVLEGDMDHNVNAAATAADMVVDEAEDMTTSLEIDVTNLRYLSKAVERAKLDLQRGVGTTTSLQEQPVLKTRHGLPYETTDFCAAATSEEESDDSWEQAIRTGDGAANRRDSNTTPKKKKTKSKSKRKSLDPEGGKKGIAAQGPPTPRVSSKPSPEKLQTLVKETRSWEGDIIIDTTEIRDEDIYGVNVLETTGSREEPIEVDDEEDPVGDDGSELLGEDLLITDQPIASPKTKGKKKWMTLGLRKSSKNKKKDSPKSESPKNKKKHASPKAPAPKATTSHRPESPRDRKSPLAASQPSYQEQYIQQQTVMLNRDEQNSSFIQQTRANDASGAKGEDHSNFAADIYKSSVSILKSFSRQARQHIQAIQQKGLINENEMDGMLGVLGEGLDETGRNVPIEADEVVIFLGDEFEKSACGVDPATFGTGKEGSSKHDKLCPEAVENMLDSMKKAYHRSIGKCGLDKAMVKENTKAMEDMVSSLKLAYGNKASSCGLGESCNNDAAFASIEQMRQSGLQRISSLSTVPFNEGQHNGKYAHSNGPLTPKAEAEQKLRCPVDADVFGSINLPEMVVKKEHQREATIAGLPKEKSLKEKSAEAVQEMLDSVKQTYSTRLSRIRTRRQRRDPTPTSPSLAAGHTTPTPEPQTFIVSINAKGEQAASPRAATSLDANISAAFATVALDPTNGTARQPEPSSGYSSVE